MAAVTMLYAETVTNITSTGGAWVDAAIIAAASFSASTKYLIMAVIDIEGSTAASEHHARLVHGATPTEFTDGDSVFDSGSGVNGGFQYGWMTVWTQPGTAELVKLQIQGESTSTATCKISQIFAMDLTLLAENSDYWYNEVTADYTTTTTPTAQASVTLTPNGTDNYFVIGNVTQGLCAALADGNDFRCDLNESVGATTTPLLDVETEDIDVGDEQRNLLLMRTWAALSAVSHTFALRPYHAGASFTVLSSRVFALRLNVFDQHAVAYTDGGVSPATSPTWTNLQTLSVTPNATGNFFYFLQGVQDTFGASSAEMNFRLQDDDDGSLGNDPSVDTSMNAPVYDVSDSIPAQLFKMKSLTAGGLRTINFDATEIVSTGNIKNRTGVLWSAELAGAAAADELAGGRRMLAMP